MEAKDLVCTTQRPSRPLFPLLPVRKIRLTAIADPFERVNKCNPFKKKSWISELRLKAYRRNTFSNWVRPLFISDEKGYQHDQNGKVSSPSSRLLLESSVALNATEFLALLPHFKQSGSAAAATWILPASRQPRRFSYEGAEMLVPGTLYSRANPSRACQCHNAN